MAPRPFVSAEEIIRRQGGAAAQEPLTRSLTRGLADERTRGVELTRGVSVEPVTTYICFRYDSVELSDEFSMRQLEDVAKAYSDPRMGDVRVVVEGHTDSDGPPEYNQVLSLARAQKIMIELARRGVQLDRLSAVGKGESEPLVTPDISDEEKGRNRRVVFRVVGQGP